jgi:hypothetical protein
MRPASLGQPGPVASTSGRTSALNACRSWRTVKPARPGVHVCAVYDPEQSRVAQADRRLVPMRLPQPPPPPPRGPPPPPPPPPERSTQVRRSAYAVQHCWLRAKRGFVLQRALVSGTPRLDRTLPQ